MCELLNKKIQALMCDSIILIRICTRKFANDNPIFCGESSKYFDYARYEYLCLREIGKLLLYFYLEFIPDIDN